MTAIIENKHTIPRHPAHVLAAEKKLRSEAPDLYDRVSRFRNCQDWPCYEMAKIKLQFTKYDYDTWITVITDFCNV